MTVNLPVHWIKRFWVSLLVMFILLEISFCQQTKTFLINGVFPITGDYPLGESHATAGQLAVDEIKSENWWPNSWDLELIITDSECQEEIAMGRVVDIVMEKEKDLIAYVGCLCPEVAEHISIVSEYYDLPVISSGATSLHLSSKAEFPTFSRVSPTDRYQNQMFISICQHYGWKKVAVLYSSQNNIIDAANDFKDLAKQNNIETPFFEEIDLTDLDNQIISLHRSLLSIIILMSDSQTAVPVLLSSQTNGLMNPGFAWLGGYWWKSSSLWETSDDPESVQTALQGVINIDFYPGIGEEYDNLFNNIGSGNNTSPNIGYTYDAVLAVGQVLKKMNKDNVDPLDRTSFRDYLNKINFQGVTGEISFTNDQERKNLRMDIQNFQENDWVLVGHWSTNDGTVFEGDVTFPGGKTSVPSDVHQDINIVKLAGLFPFSGGWPVGADVQPFFEIAIKEGQEYMPEGWILQGISFDTRCAASYGLQAFISAHDSNVDGIVGGGCSVVSTPCSLLAEAWTLPMVSWGSTSVSLSNREKYPFFRRVVAPDTSQANNWYAFCIRYGWKRVGVIYSQEDIHTQTALVFIQDAVRAGIEVVAQSFEPGGPYDFQLQGLIDKRISIIFLSSYATPDANSILVRGKELGLWGPDYAWFGSDSWNYDNFFSKAEDPEKVLEAAEGSTTITVTKGFPPNYPRILKILEEEYGITKPHDYAAYAYDATMVWVECFRQMIEAGEDPRVNGTRTLEYISQVKVDASKTCTGNVEFNQYGDRDLFFTVFSWNEGIFKEVDTWSKDTGFGDLSKQPYFLGGYVPSDQPPLTEYERSDTVLIIFVVVTIILCLVVVGVNIFWKIHEQHRLIKISSLIFSSCILFGVILYYVSVFFMAADVSTGTCQGSLWTYHIAFVLCFGCLYIKTYRLWKVFDNPSLQRLSLPDSLLFKYLSAMLAVMVLYLIIWNSIDPYEKSYDDDPGNQFVQWIVCSSDESYWEWIIAISELVFLFWGVFLAWKVRMIPTEANEATMIGYSIYNLFLVKVVLLAITETTDLNPTSLFAVKSVESLWSGTVIVIFNFLPRVYYIIFPEALKQRANRFSATPSGISGNTGKSSVSDAV